MLLCGGPAGVVSRGWCEGVGVRSVPLWTEAKRERAEAQRIVLVPCYETPGCWPYAFWWQTLQRCQCGLQNFWVAFRSFGLFPRRARDDTEPSQSRHDRKLRRHGQHPSCALARASEQRRLAQLQAMQVLAA